MSRNEPRIKPLPPSEWTEEVKELLNLPSHGFIAQKTSDYLSTLARHPGLYRRYAAFAGKLLMKGKLPARDRELAILRGGWLSQTPYDWGEHVSIARKSGVSVAEIEQIIKGPDHPAWTTRDRAILRAVDELHSTSDVSDATWNQLAGLFDDKQMIELIMLIGAYQMIGALQNALRIALPEGNAGMAAR